MTDYQLALQTGADIAIPECKLIAHQPTIYEISLCGETEYLTSIQIIAITKKQVTFQDEKDLINVNNFQIFMTAILDERLKEKAQSFKKALGLVFPNYKINFTPNSIIFRKDDQINLVDATNFDYLQQTLIDIFCLRSQGNNQLGGFNPASKKAEKIAQQLLEGRKIVAKQQNLENSSVLGQWSSCLAVGLHIPLNVITRCYTLFQLLDQVERFQLFSAWDLDIRSRLAGAKPSGELENWMKILH